MQIIKIIKEEAEKKAGKNIPESLIKNAFFFTLASFAGIPRIRFMSINGYIQYPNFFGVTIAPSGYGKNVALDICEEMFKIGFSNYTELMKADFQRLNGVLPTGDNIDDEVDYIAPSQYNVPLRGSMHGMMRVANFFNKTDMGSLNVISEEFGDELNPEVLPVLTSLWQSAKFAGSINVNQKYPPVVNVPTNVLLFGSPSAFYNSTKKHDALASAIRTGFARRSFFVWEEPSRIVPKEGNPSFDEIKGYAKQIKANIKKGTIFEYTKEAVESLQEYKDREVEKYNEEPSELAMSKVASIDKIERLSCLIAIADLCTEIDTKHVKYAIEMAEQSYKDMKTIVQPNAPYKRLYELLRIRKKGLSLSEMHEEGIRFTNKSDQAYQFEMLEDLAYRKNTLIKQKGMKYVLEELEMNKLDRIIVSLSQRSIGNEFIPYELKMFGEKPSIEALVRASDIKSFSFAHFKDSKRSIKNTISGQNCIAFDIDEGFKLKDAIETLKGFTYLIYTTKSHQREKGGSICDRFRIILPTKTSFNVDNEQHKEMMLNIANLFNLPSIDVSTRNIDRLWFTNPNAEIYKNEGELLDVRCCIPDTEKVERTKVVMDSDVDHITKNKRISGMVKWTLINGNQGNRNNSLFRLYTFVKDIADRNEAVDVVLRTNSMLDTPLEEREIEQTIFKR